MTALSRDISEKTKIITDYLTAKALDAASFDVNGLAEFPIPPEDEEPYKARLDLIALTKELHDTAVGPKEGLRYLAWDVSPPQCVLLWGTWHGTDLSSPQCVNNLSLQAIWEFKVAQAVPLEGMISYEDLTAKVVKLNNGLDIPVLNLRRLIRHAITNRIFAEPKKGFVAHTRTSRLILEDAPLNNWVGFMCNDLWLPIANVVSAMKKWPASEEPTQTGVNLAYNQSLPWFDYLQQDEVFAKRYNLAMQAHGGGEGYSLALVVEGYPWGDLPEGATVVDVNFHHTTAALWMYC